MTIKTTLFIPSSTSRNTLKLISPAYSVFIFQF